MNGEIHKCLSRLLIERYVLGEVGGAQKSLVEQAMAECESCRSEVEATEAEEKAFALRPVPAEIRKLWLDSPKRLSMRRVVLAAAPLAAGAAIALILVIKFQSGGENGEYVPAFDDRARAERTRTMGANPLSSKADVVATEGEGDLRLGFYFQAKGREEKGRDGQRLRAGDRIQFWYDAPGDGWAVIVGIDGRGQVTRYFPSEYAPDGKVIGGRSHLISSSVILDDSVGVERYYICYDKSARSPDDVLDAARRAAGRLGDIKEMNRLPVDCVQATTWIVKE